MEKINSDATMVVVDNVKKDYVVGGQTVNVLKGISVTIKKGDFFIFFGPSGCGKSTLLHAILGLERPTSGSVSFLGINISQSTEDEVAVFRKHYVGLVFQASYWIKSLSVLENVAFPLYLSGKPPEEVKARALEMLGLVGMQDWADYTPTELSSGQQQKVGLARALVADPEVVIADEPTGNLDSKSGEELMTLLTKLNQEKNKTVIMVTHDLEYMKYANRVLHIMDGQVVEEYDNSNKEKLKKWMISKRGAASQGVSEADADYLAKTKIKEGTK